MIETILIIILIAIYIRNLLSYIHLWWVKEYRIDRMMIHLGTVQGKRWWWPSWRRPPISPKTIALSIIQAGLLIFTVYLFPAQILLAVTILNIILFPITFIFVFFLTLPTRIYHYWIISRATGKIRKAKNLLVIGITGSYGKTSTKEYLAEILSVRFKVLKTEKSKNSAIGISEVILKSLKNDTEIFIVEMGAYKKGEIAGMSRIVRPQIGIITAINPQHQDLFGTIETTMEAKYELISGLTGKRTAIFNADDSRVLEMSRWAKDKGVSVLYYSKNKNDLDKNFVFQAVGSEADIDGIKFNCVYKKDKIPVIAGVIGAHQITNILAAIAGAVTAGLDLKSAVQAADKLKPAEKVMQKVHGINGSIYINDTFNNNPNAAIAALDYLNLAKGRKYLVFQPMIELGKYSQSSHVEVGEYAAKICDEIILTNYNFYDPFIVGAKKINLKKTVQVLDANKAADYIRNKLKSGDMVLFKGKEAENVYRLLSK